MYGPSIKFLHLFGGKVFRDKNIISYFSVIFFIISPPIWWKGISRLSLFPEAVEDIYIYISPPIWWKGISRRPDLIFNFIYIRFLHLFGGKVFRDTALLKKTLVSHNISPPIWWKGISRRLINFVIFSPFFHGISPPIWWKGISRLSWQTML